MSPNTTHLLAALVPVSVLVFAVAVAVTSPPRRERVEATSVSAVDPVLAADRAQSPTAVPDADDVDCLKKMADEATADAVARAPKMLAGLEAALREDAASYRASFRRRGDFLEVGLERGGRKYEGALNLSAVREIRLERGRAPDAGGQLVLQKLVDAGGKAPGCRVAVRSNAVFYSTTSSTIPVSGAASAVVTALVPRWAEVREPSHLPIFSYDQQPTCVVSTAGSSCSSGAMTVVASAGCCYYSSDEDYYVPSQPAPAPRDAVDDVLLLTGVGRINAPAGRGETLLGQVMDAVGAAAR